MKYQLNIEGMHCQGCASLIKMSLEDEGLQDVKIDLQSQTGTFADGFADESRSDETKVKIERTFAGLPGYTYHDLVTIN